MIENRSIQIGSIRWLNQRLINQYVYRPTDFCKTKYIHNYIAPSISGDNGQAYIHDIAITRSIV